MTDEGLHRPLLQQQDSDTADEPSMTRPLLHDDLKRYQQIIVHPGAFELQLFLDYIFSCWQHVLDSVYWCLQGVFPLPPVASTKLSAIQAERLDWLQSRAAEAYCPDNVEHQGLLRQLWSHAFPSLPCTSLKSGQWKEMGWQGEDPATDIRGAGRLGLDCLLYLADVHASTFSRLLGKLDGERADWEYPFAVAGLNTSFMLTEVIGISGMRAGGTAGSVAGTGTDGSAYRALKTAAGRGFVGLLSEDERAFEEVFVAAFECLDREWLRQRASYMQFNQVMKAVKAQVETALSARPGGVTAFRRKLLGA